MKIQHFTFIRPCAPNNSANVSFHSVPSIHPKSDTVCLKIGFTVARHQSKGYLQMISKEYIPEEGDMREQGRADKRRDQPRYTFR